MCRNLSHRPIMTHGLQIRRCHRKLSPLTPISAPVLFVPDVSSVTCTLSLHDALPIYRHCVAHQGLVASALLLVSCCLLWRSKRAPPLAQILPIFSEFASMGGGWSCVGIYRTDQS